MNHMGTKNNVLDGDDPSDESNPKVGVTMSTPGGGTGHGLGVEQKVAAADNKSGLQAEPPIPADTSCFSTALLTWLWPFIRKVLHALCSVNTYRPHIVHCSVC